MASDQTYTQHTKSSGKSQIQMLLVKYGRYGKQLWPLAKHIDIRQASFNSSLTHLSTIFRTHLKGIGSIFHRAGEAGTDRHRQLI